MKFSKNYQRPTHDLYRKIIEHDLVRNNGADIKKLWEVRTSSGMFLCLVNLVNETPLAKELTLSMLLKTKVYPVIGIFYSLP
jgi:hypothetical protein